MTRPPPRSGASRCERHWCRWWIAAGRSRGSIAPTVTGWNRRRTRRRPTLGERQETTMIITGLRLHRLSMPLISPFTTSFGTEHTREALIVEVEADTAAGPVTGWGECVAMEEPLYSSEYVDGCTQVISRWLTPALTSVEDLTAETVAHRLRHVVGHPMAKAAVEMAVLDAQLRASGQ